METLPAAVVGLNDEFKVVLEVDNVGSTGAGPTSLTLNVPNGASFVSASNDGAVSNSVISWTIPSLDQDEGPGYFVASLRAPSTTGAMILTAEASTSFTPQNGGTREIRADVTESLRVDDAPVLDLQLTMSPDPAAPDDELAMRFTYQNMGHVAANDVVLTSRVPAETTLDLDASSDASCSADPCVAGSTVTVDVGTLQGQANGTARLVLVVDNDTTALQISGSGALAGKNGVDALVPQAASASVQVVDGPILEVTQRADRDYVAPGGLVTYQIDYLNRGLAAANDVLLDDVIPAYTRVQAAPGASETDSGVRWSTNSLTEGQSGSVMTRLEVKGNAVVGATLGNVVALSDANQTVYAEPYDVTVMNGPVLATNLDTFPSVGAPGKPYLYTVSYTNKGTADATNATLQLAVPANVTVGSCDGCTVAGNRLTWNLGTVAMGEADSKQVVVTVNADVPEYTSLYAASYISAGTGQPRARGGTLKQAVSRLIDAQRGAALAAGGDRTTTSQRPGPLTLASTLVARAPATTIAATATDKVIRGGQIGVDAVISNMGSATATDTTLTARLPAGTTLVFAGTQATCSANPCVGESTLSWSLGTLVPGGERSVSYALSVDADADLGQRTHVLTLASTEENEQIAEATTTVVAGALTLDKSVTDADGTLNPTYAEIGDAVTYTLRVVNDNPAAAPDLVVTDVLPAEVVNCGSSCLNLRGSGASLSGNTLTWSNIDLGARESIELSYGVTIPTVASNVALENLALVRSTTGQTDTDSARLVITSIAELGITLTAPAGLQPDASGEVVIAYENTGTAATTATLTYLLPSNLSVTAADGASASGATYTWSLGSLEADATGSKTLTVRAAADAPAGDVLTHFASLEGSASNLAADATDTTVIGSVEELAISVSAPSPLTTGDTFTATVVATNSGNTAADVTEVKLTVPTGFTVSNAEGGTAAGQVISWKLNLPAGATQTLLPSIGTPATPDTGVLSAELIAAPDMTETDSTTVQVNGLTSAAIITAGAQFSVAEAKAGDSVTLIAGPVNVGGAASGTITNTVTLSAGLTATAFDGASWNADTRVLSWTTSSLSSRGSDPKTFTVRVEDAGALTATASSNGAEGTATMIRTFPEEVTITPENPDSSCKISGQPVVAAAPTPPEGITLSFANTVGFTVIDCDRNPNTSYPETLTVTIDVGQDIAADAKLYKVSDAGAWAVIEDAVITGQTVTYSITDDGDLDQDKTPGTLRDPVALAFPEGEAPPLR